MRQEVCFEWAYAFSKQHWASHSLLQLARHSNPCKQGQGLFSLMACSLLCHAPTMSVSQAGQIACVGLDRDTAFACTSDQDLAPRGSHAASISAADSFSPFSQLTMCSLNIHPSEYTAAVAKLWLCCLLILSLDSLDFAMQLTTLKPPWLVHRVLSMANYKMLLESLCSYVSAGQSPPKAKLLEL